MQFGYRYQPYNYLFDNFVGKNVTKRVNIDPRYINIQTNNNAFTADLRYYPGRKGAGKGLYISLYGRYVLFDIDHLQYSYETDNSVSYNVPWVSNSKGIAGGILVGMQKRIKNRIVIDFYTLGLHYGALTGSLASKKDLSGLSEQDRTNVKEDLEDLFYLNNHKYLSATVNDSGINGKISGSFLGIRSGICLGIAF